MSFAFRGDVCFDSLSQACKPTSFPVQSLRRLAIFCSIFYLKHVSLRASLFSRSVGRRCFVRFLIQACKPSSFPVKSLRRLAMFGSIFYFNHVSLRASLFSHCVG